MGPLGFWEIAFILVLALLIFGPKRLPQVGRTIGKGLGEFRKASDDLKRTIEREVRMDELKIDEPNLRGLDPPANTASRSSAPESGGSELGEGQGEDGDDEVGEDNVDEVGEDDASEAGPTPVAAETTVEAAEPVSASSTERK